MEKSEIIWIASVAIAKQISWEYLYFSDYMYGKEKFTDEVWEYVLECNHIGQDAFREMYKDYQLYF